MMHMYMFQRRNEPSYSKSEKCIFIGYKGGLKGYKIWNPVTRKVVYSRDVVFREVKDVIKHEVQPNEPEKIGFELKEEESNSIAEEELEDEEPQTPTLRRSVRERRQPERYSPSASVQTLLCLLLMMILEL